MILSASREFDRNRNPLIVDRESDNVELPKVCLKKRKDEKKIIKNIF